jgi:uncharacterized membrane protein YeaQ/YmgE (transglycosylase-associated protein family)
VNKSDVSGDTDVLLKLHEEQWGFLRQNEDQRAQITNMVLLIASALVGFIAQKGLNREMLPLTILLIALGLYGAVASEKLYERFGFFRARAEAIERKLDRLHPAPEIFKIWKEAAEINAREFPRLHRLRLHHLWLALHLGIAITGVTLTLFVAFVR